MLYDYFWIKNERSKNVTDKILAGLVIGGIGILLMLTPWTYVPGIVFDTRSILLSVAGLFFGFIPTSIAIILTGIFRIILGGEGMWMGIAVIILSGLTGIVWKEFKPEWQRHNHLLQLLFLGLVVHVIMLICTVLLPSDRIWPTFKAILFSLIIIYPAGTMLLGSLMVRRSKNWQAREKLHESEARYKRLHESMTDAFAMVDMGGKIIESNPAFRKMLGFSEEELLNFTFFQLTPERWHASETSIINDQLLIKGSSGVYEKEYIRKDGSILPVELRSFLLKDKNNKPKAIWAIVRDIEDRKKTEHELIKAKEKAEQNDRLKSIFLANMSHEIRTPMNGILGFTQILRQTRTDEHKREHYLDVINSSCDRLFNVVNDLMDISKIESGMLEIKATPVNINKLLDELHKFHVNQCNTKGLSFIIYKSLSDDGAAIITDEKMLQQVLSILISNAIKFTHQGKISIAYTLYGKWIEFAVEDTGIGIESKYKDIIFERFRQVEETYTREYEGNGLGLSIAKAYIEELGGRIWLKSSMNEGSTFYFTIPFEPAKNEYLIPHEVKNTPSYNWDGKKILIAEDDDLNFELINEILLHTKSTILHAYNGVEAVEIHKKEKPHLILMDIKMPIMNGFESTKIIRETDSSIPIIALTAYAYEADMTKAREMGMNDYLSKPISVNMLLSKLEMFLI
jgi:PAS domain S-box-containing protein